MTARASSCNIYDYVYANDAELQGIVVQTVNKWIGHDIKRNVSKSLNGSVQQSVLFGLTTRCLLYNLFLTTLYAYWLQTTECLALLAGVS